MRFFFLSLVFLISFGGLFSARADTPTPLISMNGAFVQTATNKANSFMSNVGIGTTTPLAPMHIAGTNGTAAGTGLIVGGTVAVGTTVPTEVSILNLHTTSSGVEGLILGSGTVGNAPFITWKTADTPYPLYSVRYEASGPPHLAFGVGAASGYTEQVAFTASGSVGIGTTNPEATLDVAGAIRTAAGQNFKIRYGRGSLAVSQTNVGLAGTQAVSFGYTFSSAPVVIVTGTSAGAWQDILVVNAINITTTGFTVYVSNPQTVNTISTTDTYNWVAIGE